MHNKPFKIKLRSLKVIYKYKNKRDTLKFGINAGGIKIQTKINERTIVGEENS
jgi:hypothetical protein